MSNTDPSSKLVAYVTAYKESCPDMATMTEMGLTPGATPDAVTGLPMDTTRANHGVKTKTAKYGQTKMSSQGTANVSKPKK